jgi:hypothetical protein
MMLNKKEPFTEIWGEDRAKGIVHGQWQDDGTGRAVYRQFNNIGWQVDGEGQIIDPDYISPEEEAKMLKDQAKEEALTKSHTPSAGMTWDSIEDLMLADRIKIVDPAKPGYLEVEDIQAELKKLGVRYHHKAGREKLLNLLKEELKLGVET